MDFFKSVFSGQPEPPSGAGDEEGAAEGVDGSREGTGVERGSSGADEGGGRSWGAFSGIIQTLVSKSEPLIETYRRDLEEFGSGLRKETEVIREVIRELPSSLEASASVAQESLGTVGQALDGLSGSVWRGTAEIIAQGKDALLSLDVDTSADLSSAVDASQPSVERGASNRLSRLAVKLQGIQADLSTVTEEPEDAEDFRSWLAGFSLPEREKEIKNLLEESRALQGNLARLVPDVIDYDTFWSRYFYKVHKLKQAEDVRANLVKRAISGEEEEDLSWEVEDDDVRKSEKEEQKDGQQSVESQGGDQVGAHKRDISAMPERDTAENPDSACVENSSENSETDNLVKDATTSSGEKESSEMSATGFEGREAPIKIDDKILPEGIAESAESCKDSDVSIVSTQPSIPEEDDLGWDEIEDLGDNDEKKPRVSAGSPNRIDLRKRLTTAEDEDDDLGWDIEDDEPKKP
ncbi:unnamed protein product [Spirodela intermedia]|uniref:BSD domain-containing protein n=1 Tax=Spirodela intermedia TaxID=51605 RepID=A0A7I8KRW2_SPIIN|nr:unnamed protein product [Spirodela intermedia]